MHLDITGKLARDCERGVFGAFTPCGGTSPWRYVIVSRNGSNHNIAPCCHPVLRHVNAAWMTSVALLSLELCQIWTKNASTSGFVFCPLQRPLHSTCFYDLTSDAAIRCSIGGAMLERLNVWNKHHLHGPVLSPTAENHVFCTLVTDDPHDLPIYHHLSDRPMH